MYTYPQFLDVTTDGLRFTVDLFAFFMALLSLCFQLAPLGAVSLPLLFKLLDLLLQLVHLSFLKRNSQSE